MIEERAKFALHIFKHCWFGSQPWMAIVAYALYMLYSKSISATAGQPEGKARNFPSKKKRSHCSQEFFSQVNSFVSSFLWKTDLASSSSITPLMRCSGVLSHPLMTGHCYSLCSVSYSVFHFSINSVKTSHLCWGLLLFFLSNTVVVAVPCW